MLAPTCITRSAPAAWVTTRWPWSTRGCAVNPLFLKLQLRDFKRLALISFCLARAGARTRATGSAIGRWTTAWTSQQARQDLLGQQREGLVAERRAEEVVEADLLAQA